jgi:hypothetical protein
MGRGRRGDCGSTSPTITGWGRIRTAPQKRKPNQPCALPKSLIRLTPLPVKSQKPDTHLRKLASRSVQYVAKAGKPATLFCHSASD